MVLPEEKHLEMEKAGRRWDLEAEEESLRAFAVEEAHILSAMSFLFSQSNVGKNGKESS